LSSAEIYNLYDVARHVPFHPRGWLCFVLTSLGYNFKSIVPGLQGKTTWGAKQTGGQCILINKPQSRAQACPQNATKAHAASSDQVNLMKGQTPRSTNHGHSWTREAIKMPCSGRWLNGCQRNQHNREERTLHVYGPQGPRETSQAQAGMVT
jgi:hypothetical protein